MKKLTVLALVLVVALAILGIGYAKWFETVAVNATVNTGNVDVKLECGECWDTDDWVEGEGDIKDVSDITCEVDTETGKKATVTITNAYPCIDYYCEGTFTNIGTIPIKIEGITLNRENMPVNALIEAEGLAEGQQIEPGETVRVRLHVHLYNADDPDHPDPTGVGTLENHNYSFDITFDAVQWNEYGT